tara:strand:+ start:148 stop:1761 length:1614 start_codon:yes stop_codon:yes gene_type:complete
MDLISPSPQDTQKYFEDQQNTEENSVIYKDYNDDVSTPPSPPSFSKKEEKTIEIETDLFIARVSSAYGGTIRSFKTKEHLKNDSSLVELISPENKNNLILSYKDFTGEDITIDSGWVLQEKEDSFLINSTKTFTFINEFENKKLIKTLTVYPNRFVIDIDIDITAISNNTLANSFSLEWVGGIPPTEKDSIAELAYFYSYLYQGGELLDIKVGDGETFKNNYKGDTDWIATRSKYFVVCILDDSKEQFVGSAISASFKDKELYNISAQMQSNKIANISLYLGPLEYERIKSLGVNLELIMDFGWAIIRPISKAVLWVLKTMHTVIPNYGVILIIFSILVKLIVYPLTKKSYQSTQAMQSIQPEINALREKHKNNPTKLNQATMELYKKKGVNPLGSCFPMLLQMPLLFALFTVFRSTIELRGEPFVFWIKDLSAPDVLFYLPFKIPLYGNYVCALPILMALSMYAQQKMMQPGNVSGPQADQQKMMQYFMMGFFFLLFNSFPSGLNLYYTLFNILTIAQQKLTKSEKKMNAPIKTKH